MSEIEKYYNGEIIVDFEEETELEKKYNEVAELYSKAVKKKIEYHKEIERLNNIINELEKYCNDEINEGNKALEKLSEIYNSSDTESFIKGQQAKCEHILDKLQELKGDGSNEKDTNE